MDPLVLWSLGLLVLGLVLLVAEFFVPSAGLISVSAALSLVAAIVLAIMVDLRLGLFVMLVEAVSVPGILYGAVKYWPNTFLGQLILIRLPESDEEILPESHFARKELVGRYGKAKTKMLPSGSIEIAGQTYDAVSEGMPIEAGQTIKVVAARTRQLIVRPVEAPEMEEAEGEEKKNHRVEPHDGGDSETADLENIDFDSL